jgi:hypothetical protein
MKLLDGSWYSSNNSSDAAEDWISQIRQLAGRGIDPNTATTTLSAYGRANMKLALRGLEGKTTDPYLAGWNKRVLSVLGHLPITMITNGAVDRAVHTWISDGCSRSTVKNSLAVLVRVLEQAVRDGIIDRNPARISGWQREYELAEDELEDPFARASQLGCAHDSRRCARREVSRSISGMGRRRHLRGPYRGTHRRSVGMPGPRHQYR